MRDIENRTRKDKYEKRRKNTKSTSILIVVSVILVISLISVFVFGGGNNETVDESPQESTENNTSNDSEEVTIKEEETSQQEEDQLLEDDTQNETDSSEENNEENGQDIEQVEPSDDNVSEAYTADWEPVGTQQEGPHTVDYNNGSQDRLEMKEAILMATGLSENDYHEWWIGNGGNQKVIATVSDEAQSEIYRVYLSWRDNEGWQPTKVEVLIENDWKKYQ
ncbi:DUF1510 family protein [Oceanobacillus piezotolerans]|uniref:DUF1510 family protein n=1 Tax=Oceanobacillus piezotolerans TaxID=2448030 RepID=A0A498DLU3_9BACI|nr:YrrS family protein [Oceanobacillus piezotolerans]RLL48010.1 DUF1510 family protein [Oceanobacillus piezotolerans]